MPAVSQDITAYAGDTLIITIPVLDGSGANVNLAGAGASWWMGKNATATGTDVYIKKSLGQGMTLTDNTAGLYTLAITLAPQDTENLTAGTFYHEAAVIDANGDIARISLGKFILKPTLIPDADIVVP
jgi:hypothetical protein